MIHHYITKYEENGKLFVEARMQIDIFGKSFCFSKRKVMIGRRILQSFPTSYLVEELKKREGVATTEAAPYEPFAVNGTGAAVVLVVRD